MHTYTLPPQVAGLWILIAASVGLGLLLAGTGLLWRTAGQRSRWVSAARDRLCRAPATKWLFPAGAPSSAAEEAPEGKKAGEPATPGTWSISVQAGPPAEGGLDRAGLLAEVRRLQALVGEQEQLSQRLLATLQGAAW